MQRHGGKVAHIVQDGEARKYQITNVLHSPSVTFENEKKIKPRGLDDLVG